jgi:hypothetical protein
MLDWRIGMQRRVNSVEARKELLGRSWLEGFISLLEASSTSRPKLNGRLLSTRFSERTILRRYADDKGSADTPPACPRRLPRESIESKGSSDRSVER